MKLLEAFVNVAIGIVASHVEQGLGDRERRAQFVRRIGCEPSLIGDMSLEPRKHGVECVGEFTEFILVSLGDASKEPASQLRFDPPIQLESSRGG